MLPFGASKETWATTYSSNRLPASKALLGEPLETLAAWIRRPRGRGFHLGGITNDPFSVQRPV